MMRDLCNSTKRKVSYGKFLSVWNAGGTGKGCRKAPRCIFLDLGIFLCVFGWFFAWFPMDWWCAICVIEQNSKYHMAFSCLYLCQQTTLTSLVIDPVGLLGSLGIPWWSILKEIYIWRDLYLKRSIINQKFWTCRSIFESSFEEIEILSLHLRCWRK